MHGIRWMEVVEPEVLINGEIARGIAIAHRWRATFYHLISHVLGGETLGVLRLTGNTGYSHESCPCTLPSARTAKGRR